MTLLRGAPVCIYLLLGGVLCGAWAAPQAGDAGVPPEWEIRADLKLLAAHLDSLEAALEEVHAWVWPDESPRQTYLDQLQAIRDQASYIRRSAGELSSDPNRLTVALETYLRLQSLNELLLSLSEGVRHYQSEGAADRLRNAISAGAAPRDKLREYMVRLAAEMESQARVMALEAQRCREALSRQPQARPNNSGRSESK